jgi:hypothetical protein
MCTFSGVITINKIRVCFEFNRFLIINPLKPEIHLDVNYIHNFSSYLKEDTAHFHYKNSLQLIKINAAYSEDYKKHIPVNTLCRQNIEPSIVRAGSTYINHCALKGYCINMTVIFYFNGHFLKTKGNSFRYILTL